MNNQILPGGAPVPGRGSSASLNCKNCEQEISIAHPTGSGWLYKHDRGGYILCIVSGARPGTRAEPY